MRRYLEALFVLLLVLPLAGCAATAPRGSDRASTKPAESPKEGGAMDLTSPAFADGSPMPVEYATRAAGGRNVSPPLEWSSPPTGAASFALECVDMHPRANGWVHWLVADIPPSARSLPKGASGTAMPAPTRELPNTFGTPGWGGPQPPPGSGPHTYRFTLYALDVTTLDLPRPPSPEQFRAALEGHVLAEASLDGTFER